MPRADFPQSEYQNFRTPNQSTSKSLRDAVWESDTRVADFKPASSPVYQNISHIPGAAPTTPASPDKRPSSPVYQNWEQKKE
jgi:hypothetical protein